MTAEEKNSEAYNEKAKELLKKAQRLRRELGESFHDNIVEGIFAEAHRIAERAIKYPEKSGSRDWEVVLDRLLISKFTGYPIMFAMLAIVLWLTIQGANYPSELLYDLLLGKLHPALKSLVSASGAPQWLVGLLVDGAYLSTAWVISVMLPPMAIFFPLFTLLEDFGFLPRVAFNLDNFFRKVGAHGKQALTMSMGFGCNAAGVIATRIIDSPRERLIAIITNNFALCNGRWPTQILLASVFIAPLAPPYLAGMISAASVIAVALLGVGLTLGVSLLLSKTVLKGIPSTFSLELPPYRPPRFWQTLYTSLIDRTVYVLWRAIVFAFPAGIIIWIISNVSVEGEPLAKFIIDFLDPFAIIFGLNGIILLAYIVAIPANEIVIPTILMLTVLIFGVEGYQQGVLFEADSLTDVAELLKIGGWTFLTAINVMIFSLAHNPCSTTIYTIYKETGSWKWTLLSVAIPLAIGFALTFLVTVIYGAI